MSFEDEKDLLLRWRDLVLETGAPSHQAHQAHCLLAAPAAGPPGWLLPAALTLVAPCWPPPPGAPTSACTLCLTDEQHFASCIALVAASRAPRRPRHHHRLQHRQLRPAVPAQPCRHAQDPAVLDLGPHAQQVGCRAGKLVARGGVHTQPLGTRAPQRAWPSSMPPCPHFSWACCCALALPTPWLHCPASLPSLAPPHQAVQDEGRALLVQGLRHPRLQGDHHRGARAV